ncbi:MAG: NUDIX domain-containing protein [Candidatus Paceibacterota bacterium]
MTYIISPTRALLVIDESKCNPLWKIPGGTIELTDEGVIAAATRESFEETGVQLLPEEVVLFSKEKRRDGIYYPHLCVASVSEEKLDTRARVTYESGENDRPLKTGVLNRAEVPVMLDLLERHRHFVHEVEGYHVH